MLSVSLPITVSDNHNLGDNLDKMHWVKTYIQVSRQKNYPIFASTINNEVFIKPFKKILNTEFEDLFGFKMECSDYNPNKIVWVKNASLRYDTIYNDDNTTYSSL